MDLLDQLKKDFDALKADLGFKATFKELDDVFFLQDFILQSRFVSPNLARMIAYRITDTFNSWVSQLHQYVMPPPGSMPANEESRVLEAKKDDIINVMKVFLALTSKNAEIGLSKSKKDQAQFFDDALKTWNENKAFLIECMRTINENWTEEK